MTPLKTTLNLALLSLILLTSNCQPKQETGLDSTNDHQSSVLTEGKIEAYDSAFWQIIARDAKIEIIAEGHAWTEGPLWVESEGMLLYADIPANAIYQWKNGDKATVYLHHSGYLEDDFQGSEPGANGLLLNQNGELVLCQHGLRQMAKMNAPINSPKPSFLTLTSHFNGKRYNSPNDAAFKSNGDLYFTDPPYGLPGGENDATKELPYQGVFKVDSAGNVTLLTDEFTRPNGLAFSPDEKKLYVANSDPEHAIWKVFDVNEDGNIVNGRIFYDATALTSKEKGLPDGLKIDSNGYIFATGPGGVFVFEPSGKILGKILTGQATSNCALNNDESVLFITADSYVLKVDLNKSI